MICICVKVDLNKSNQPSRIVFGDFFIPKIGLWPWKFLFRDLPWLLAWKKLNWCQCFQERVQVLRNENVYWFAWWSPTFFGCNNIFSLLQCYPTLCWYYPNLGHNDIRLSAGSQLRCRGENFGQEHSSTNVVSGPAKSSWDLQQVQLCTNLKIET